MAKYLKRVRKPISRKTFKQRYRSRAYTANKRKVFKRDGHKCQFPQCETNGKIVCHHIKKYHDFPLLRNSMSNLITLCHEHHCVVTGREEQYELMFMRIILRKKELDATE